MKPRAVLLSLLAPGLFAACTSARPHYATTGGGLQLSKVVLYRNGVGYFERAGHVDGDVLTLRVRKDQVNDLLKSLTVVEKTGGRAVSISMPLDPRAWANAAIATLGPGAGSLYEVLDKLRGTDVTLHTDDDTVRGRILIVEAIPMDREPSPLPSGASGGGHEQDYKVTLIDDKRMHVVRLSKVTSIALHNADISMQFQRSLDATAGEGMFQQVDVTIRLAGAHAHELVVSYVVNAPMWKPTYRVVLPEKGKGQALLQGWAVVDNTTGEDWRDVSLSLTSGAPIAFRYDLHTPRDVMRTDLSSVGSDRHAQVSVGETTYADAPAAAPPPPPAPPASMPYPQPIRNVPVPGRGDDSRSNRKSPRPSSVSSAGQAAPTTPAPSGATEKYAKEDESGVDADMLESSMVAKTHAATVSGLSRYDLGEALTVPDGTSTMVAIINQQVEGQETFLFRPGGAGQGYEANPYRVIRFKNSTPFALESGPISIYSGGSFVGEGISEPVSAGVPVTIPFAVESGIMVTSQTQYKGDDVRLVKIVRGVIEIETFSRRTTTWAVKSQLPPTDKTTVFVRMAKAGGTYKLSPRPANTEDLPDAYLIPIEVAAGATDGKLEVVEQTPSRSELSIWDSRFLTLFEGILAQGNLDPATRAKLQPIVKLRQDVGRIDTEIEGKTRTRGELDQRAQETRQNLEAIKKDPAAGALRKKLSDRLEQFAKDGDKLGRDLVELQTKRTEQKVALEDALQALDLTPREPLAPKP